MKLTSKIPPKHQQMLFLYILGIVFVFINLILDPSILKSWSRVCSLAMQFAPLMLCAMAQSCVLLTGGIDLSLGVTVSLMTAIVAVTMGQTTGSLVISILLALVSGLVIGAIMGCVVTFGKIPAIIVTLAFSYIWKGVALYILPVPGGTVNKELAKFMDGRYGIPGAAIAVLMALIVWKLFKNSSAGIALYSVGDNEKVAYNNGLNVKKARISAYMLSGIFTALAGVLMVCRTGSGDATVGVPYQMNSVAASVLGGVSFLGGLGQMKGVIIGSFIITSLVNILFFAGVDTFYQYVVQGIILVVAMGAPAILKFIRREE